MHTVFDLPQIYTKPSADSLLHALDLLSSTPSSFSASAIADPTVFESGVPRYLTTIISSSLSWIESNDQKDAVYAAAAARLAERSGRAAAPSLTRTFQLTPDIRVTLHEPSLTEDNLGLKTWSSSLLLAQHLEAFRQYLPPLHVGHRMRVLELGAGTGLVGIAAACIWGAEVTLTDLSGILPNLEGNIRQNAELIAQSDGQTAVKILDWADASLVPRSESLRFPVIVAADPIYSTEHPKILVEAVVRWLALSNEARFIVELPLRDGYNSERADLKKCLKDAGLVIEGEGEDLGFDDWDGPNGEKKGVRCWWGVWMRDLDTRAPC